jgi:ribosomal protein S18 acetylase RimI-like enzyme
MLVGGIASRYERPAGGGGATRLYIMSLGVLAPYRGRGVGQRLLVRALAEAVREGSAGDVYLHVQARPSREKQSQSRGRF